MRHFKHKETTVWCPACSSICLYTGRIMFWRGLVMMVASIWKPVRAVRIMDEMLSLTKMTDEDAVEANKLLRNI